MPSTARRLIHLFHMNVLFSGFKTIFPGRNCWNASRKQMTEAIIWYVWILLFRKDERHPVWTGKFCKIRWIWKGNPDTVTFSSIYGLSEPYLSGKAVHFDKKSYTFDSQIASILQYINHNLKEDLSVETLSARYYVSKYHLMRKFKQETGYTLHNYIVNKRLLMARTLISNGMPVTKAAQESGFTEYSTFSRAYRKQFKTTPAKNCLIIAIL